MVDLKAQSPCAGLLPLEAGNVRLREVEMRQLTLIAPMAGKAAALETALKAEHGLSWPEAGTSSEAGGASLIWFGYAQALLVGATPSAKLAAHAAVTDQSDAWSCVVLEGADAAAVLSRVTPLDLRDAACPVGAALRTELFHMPVSITRLGSESWQIMGFRSMAKTLVHDLERAMKSVAARAEV